MFKVERVLVDVKNIKGLTELCGELLSMGYRLEAAGKMLEGLERLGLSVFNLGKTGYGPALANYLKKIKRGKNEFVIVVGNMGSTSGSPLEGGSFDRETLIRLAARNFERVILLTDPDDYERLVEALKAKDVPLMLRKELAARGFEHLSRFDAEVARYVEAMDENGEVPKKPLPFGKERERSTTGDVVATKEGLKREGSRLTNMMKALAVPPIEGSATGSGEIAVPAGEGEARVTEGALEVPEEVEPDAPAPEEPAENAAPEGGEPEGEREPSGHGEAEDEREPSGHGEADESEDPAREPSESVEEPSTEGAPDASHGEAPDPLPEEAPDDQPVTAEGSAEARPITKERELGERPTALISEEERSELDEMKEENVGELPAEEESPGDDPDPLDDDEKPLIIADAEEEPEADGDKEPGEEAAKAEVDLTEEWENEAGSGSGHGFIVGMVVVVVVVLLGGFGLWYKGRGGTKKKTDGAATDTMTEAPVHQKDMGAAPNPTMTSTKAPVKPVMKATPSVLTDLKLGKGSPTDNRLVQAATAQDSEYGFINAGCKACVVKGLKALSSSHYSIAVTLFNESLKTMPEDAETRSLLSLAYHALRKDKQALAEALAALKTDPKSKWALLVAGSTEQIHKNYVNAYTHFENFLKISKKGDPFYRDIRRIQRVLRPKVRRAMRRAMRHAKKSMKK